MTGISEQREQTEGADKDAHLGETGGIGKSNWFRDTHGLTNLMYKENIKHL